MNIKYLDIEHIIFFNKEALRIWKVKKGDKHEILSYAKLLKVINDYKELEGDFYDKAVHLIKGITKAHAFASGNRRTAIISVVIFALENKQKVFIPDNPTNSRVLLGIRYNYYTDEEIKEWIKHGKIKEYPKR